ARADARRRPETLKSHSGLHRPGKGDPQPRGRVAFSLDPRCAEPHAAPRAGGPPRGGPPPPPPSYYQDNTPAEAAEARGGGRGGWGRGGWWCGGGAMTEGSRRVAVAR